MSTVSLDITGMTCAACSARIEKALSRTEGVRKAEVNLALERASVETDDRVTPQALVAAVEKTGYGARLRSSDEAERRAADEQREEERRREERLTLWRFIISAALSLPLVIGTLPMMIGTGHAWISPWTQAILATGVMLVSGTRFLREAFAAVRGGGANMAVLVSLGTSVAYVYSLVLVISGDVHAHLYFEAAAVVLTLIMLGKYLEARAKRGTSAALAALHKLQPREAELIGADGAARVVAVETLKPGDRVLVRPGGRMPCDGKVAKGHSAIDESLVTGESLPVDKEPGDAVITGTVNGEAALEIEVTAVGPDTRLARMTRLVEEAQTGQAPIQRLVDRISAIFVPVILVVAAATFLIWWLVVGDATGGMVAAVAVLVIACPCALGLATPTALVAGTGAAARAGILIRDIETLERAEEIGAIAFDKTGTLTIGKPEVVAAEGDDATLALAAAIEAHSEHPLARALVEKATGTGAPLPAAAGVRAIRGKGLSGTVDGRSVSVGNRRLVEEAGIAGAEIDAMLARLGEAGTVAFIVVDGQLSGAVRFADTPRPEAAETVAELKRRGLAPVMLTGDNEAAAESIGGALGFADIRAGLLPEEKVEAVRKLAAEQGDKGVAFVGDGLNDGPALAAARLGIAMSSGADVAREAAAITLMRTDLRLVPAALDIAHKTRRTIAHNLGWAFVYNVIGIPLAAFGVLSPAFAGAAMAFSSVSVVTNSALLARWKPRLPTTEPQ
ncbi:MAG: cation-translocating P-type ATPase [Aquamicrobium sp.]|uniref:heavy metal translocating P-type ATPase n=1 Tax=Aquamicrobium sp. TaxID=1872579 RepID=UPI00349E8B09|nr:cation-translocating P-type ATPase [Aquamicrobium sp.]